MLTYSRPKMHLISLLKVARKFNRLDVMGCYPGRTGKELFHSFTNQMISHLPDMACVAICNMLYDELSRATRNEKQREVLQKVHLEYFVPIAFDHVVEKLGL